MVCDIFRNRDTGMVKERCPGSKWGRTEGSSPPKKVRCPFILFSLTVCVIIQEQPEPNWVVTAPGSLESNQA